MWVIMPSHSQESQLKPIEHPAFLGFPCRISYHCVFCTMYFPSHGGNFIPCGFVLTLCIFPTSWIFPALFLIGLIGYMF